jgi:hypothetical protein
MSDRARALRSKLPPELVSRIGAYDSHATADLIRSLAFRDLAGSLVNPPRKLISCTGATYSVPNANEIRRRTLHNRQPSRVWLPILANRQSWLLKFDTWRFQTVPELDYRQDWVVEQFAEA